MNSVLKNSNSITYFNSNPALDPFTNPVPVKFLKVLPNVTFCFQFRLSDGLIKKEQKLNLIRHILLTLGIGAKTNIGYGQFVNEDQYHATYRTEQLHSNEEQEEVKTPGPYQPPGKPDNDIPADARPGFVKNETFSANVAGFGRDYYLFDLIVNGKKCILVKNKKSAEKKVKTKLQIGCKVTIRINNPWESHGNEVQFQVVEIIQ